LDGENKIKEKCPNPIGRVLRHGAFHDVACKSWKCHVCSRVKKLKLIKRFEHNKGSFRYRMLTLTEWKNPDNFDNSLRLTEHWNRLRASLRKHNIIMKDYIWTKEYKPLYASEDAIIKQAKKFNALKFEDAIKYVKAHIEDLNKDWKETSETALFYPHMHVSIPAYIDLDLIKRLWFLATKQTADQVHIPEDDELPSNPMAYMTKYLLKSDMLDGFHKHERRYGCSRKYPAGELAQNYEYEINGEIIKGSYVPFYGDKNALYIPNKFKIPDEVLKRNEKRLNDNYAEAKEAINELRLKCDAYFKRRYELDFNETLDYSDCCKHLHDLEDYIRFDGLSTYDIIRE